MKSLVIEPSEMHRCTLSECPPGLFAFIVCGEIMLGFKAANQKSFVLKTGNVIESEEGMLEVLPCYVAWLE